MNWQMIGAIGEVIGAIGVIGTLVYLARQVRASTRAARQATAQEVLSGARVLLQTISSDASVARSWRLGMAADPSLTPDEFGQFGALLTLLIYDWDRIYHLGLEGGIDAWMVESNRATRRDICGSPGFRRWFEQRKHWISDDLRAALEVEMAHSQGYRPLGVAAQPSELRAES